MSAPQSFLLALLTIFTAPYLVWRLIGGDARCPLVVVQILAGVLLGPGVLGAFAPACYRFLFQPQGLQALNGVAWWAVALFVWAAGLELDLRATWTHRRETAVTAGLALLAPLVLGAAAAGVMLTSPVWIGPRGSAWQAMLGVGMACAVTALPILVLFLEQLDALHRPLGQRILRYASLDDVAIWVVLALILVDGARLGRQLGFLAGFAAASLAMRALTPRLREADRWAAGLIWLTASGFAADWSGLHFMVGAFLSGAVLDAAWFDRRRLEGFRQTVLSTLMPTFFLSTGLHTQFGVGGAQVFGAAALLLSASVAGKHLGVALAGRWLGWAEGEAVAIGWLLQTKALIMIIFADVLLDRGVISGRTFTALLLMAVASTVLTPPMVRRALARRPILLGEAVR